MVRKEPRQKTTGHAHQDRDDKFEMYASKIPDPDQGNQEAAQAKTDSKSRHAPWEKGNRTRSISQPCVIRRDGHGCESEWCQTKSKEPVLCFGFVPENAAGLPGIAQFGVGIAGT